TTPAWRAIGPDSADGLDVQQLQASLRDLGFDPSNAMTVDGHYNAATGAAIRRWQTTLGLDPSGVIDDGDVAFEPGPVRVGALHATLGGFAHPGDAPFDVTGGDRTVRVPLDPGRARGIAFGAPVGVDLLDGTTTTGTVSALSRVAPINDPSAGNPAT